MKHRQCLNSELTVADPGFPGGGIDLVGEGVDSWGSYVSKILYVEMKESGPLSGACAGHATLDPPMTWVVAFICWNFQTV